jgi:hypothetical protein
MTRRGYCHEKDKLYCNRFTQKYRKEQPIKYLYSLAKSTSNELSLLALNLKKFEDII